jgi:hypothetical protein
MATKFFQCSDLSNTSAEAKEAVMIETRLLQQVVILAEARSYVKAAKMLHLSQPALSRSILQKEKELAQKYLDKT